MVNYEDENLRLPCPLCKQPSAPTVFGDHMKCLSDGHIWNPDGEPLEFECMCTTCNPQEKEGKSMEELSKSKKKRKVAKT